MATSNWDNAYSDVLNWTTRNTNPGVAHTLTLTNHHLGPRHYALRICVRDAAGCILVASSGRRRTKYLPIPIEDFIIENLCGALCLAPSQCRVHTGPDTHDKPSFPLWFNDPITWQTETLTLRQEIAESGTALK
jgi:hypothetical protein